MSKPPVAPGGDSAPMTELHVCQDGPSDAPTLVLIHGTGASTREWDPMVELLTESHHVVRVDLPGCGRSPKPKSYAVPDQIRLVGAALDEVGVEKAIVVGHSSGSAFATALAEERPDLVEGLVFINFGPNMAAYIAKEVPLRGASWSELTDDQIRFAIRDGFAEGFVVPKSFVDQFRDIDFEAFMATTQTMRAYLNERGLPDRLTPLGKPLLVLFGAEDQRWSPASAAEFRAVPGARVEMLSGLGHSPNLEDPPRTAALLLAFTAG